MHHKTQPLENHLTIAAATTLVMHLPRVALNRASFHTSIIATLKDCWSYMINGYMFKGIAFNTARGAMSTGLQSFANQRTREYYGEGLYSKLCGLLSASSIGTTVAVFIETSFMRRAEGAELKPAQLFKLNKPITTFFFFREAGFATAVLGAKDFSPITHYCVLAAASWMTAACHKLAMIEATRDLVKHQFTVPDYSKGMRRALSDISKGIYAHPSLKPLYPQPNHYLHRGVNVMYATCGFNMFVFRIAYLKGFSEALNFFRNVSNKQEDNNTHTNIAPKK